MVLRIGLRVFFSGHCGVLRVLWEGSRILGGFHCRVVQAGFSLQRLLL